MHITAVLWTACRATSLLLFRGTSQSHLLLSRFRPCKDDAEDLADKPCNHYLLMGLWPCAVLLAF